MDGTHAATGTLSCAVKHDQLRWHNAALGAVGS